MRLLLRPRLQILCRFVRVGVFGRNRRLHASCDDVGFYVMRLISVLLLPESVGDSRSLCCELLCVIVLGGQRSELINNQLS
jgi:hypothetical protein